MTDDWHTSDYPELRPGPPWVMEEMIRCPGGAARRPRRARRRARDLRRCGPGRWPPARRSSSSAAAPPSTPRWRSPRCSATVSRLARDARRIRAQQALDAALDPRRTASSSASATMAGHAPPGSRSTGAPRRRRHRGDHRAAGLRRRRRGRPRPLDAPPRSLVVPYGGLYERHHSPARRSPTPSRERAWQASTGDARNRPCRRPRPNRRTSVSTRSQRVLCVGTGTDLINARELALKIEEGARIAATAHHLETLLHGHLAGCEPASTRVVFLAATATSTTLPPTAGARHPATPRSAFRSTVIAPRDTSRSCRDSVRPVEFVFGPATTAAPEWAPRHGRRRAMDRARAGRRSGHEPRT